MPEKRRFSPSRNLRRTENAVSSSPAAADGAQTPFLARLGFQAPRKRRSDLIWPAKRAKNAVFEAPGNPGELHTAFLAVLFREAKAARIAQTRTLLQPPCLGAIR